MALLISDRFAGRSEAPSSEYPFGAFKDKTSPTGTDGTPLVADWPNDIYGFLQTLLAKAGVTPSGQPDRVGGSQYYSALLSLLKVPAGQVAYFAQATAPDGYLRANGAAVSRTAYPELFAAIGTRYGAGNGVTTFNLPDGRGVFPRGLDDGRGLDPLRVLGSYQADSFRSHTHAAGAAWAADVSLTAENIEILYDGAPGGGEARRATITRRVTNPATGTFGHTHDIHINNTGGTETRPVNVAWLCCIKY